MVLWVASIVLFVLGIRLTLGEFDFGSVIFGIRREKLILERVASRLQEIEEILGSGLVPSPTDWASVQELPPPWGRLASDNIQELRSQGGAILPTLRRLKELARNHRELLSQAQSKSSQALAQALIAAILVPAFGLILYGILPGISERSWLWLLAMTFALFSSLTGAGWMLLMADSGRWAGLKKVERPWLLSVQCAGERMLALIRSGQPGDLAWSRALEFLGGSAPELALEWGYSVWGKDASIPSGGSRARKLLANLGVGLKKSVQAGVLDGKPCSERIEIALHGFTHELQALVDRDLALLPTRILKPLFIFVAPAILGLVGFGLFLAFSSATGGGDVF